MWPEPAQSPIIGLADLDYLRASTSKKHCSALGLKPYQVARGK